MGCAPCPRVSMRCLAIPRGHGAVPAMRSGLSARAPLPTLQTAVREERAQLRVGFLRRLLREIVAARQRLGAADVGGVVLPHLGRLVVAADRAGCSPQDQGRAVDLLAGGEIL